MSSGDSRTEVRSPTRTEVRSPTRTSTWAKTQGNFTSTVTGGAGAGETRVTINIPGHTIPVSDTGGLFGPGDWKDQAKVILEPHPTLVGAISGAVIGSLIGKQALFGAMIGVAVAHLSKAYLQGKL